jgi:hypothetical protein
LNRFILISLQVVLSGLICGRAVEKAKSRPFVIYV